MKKLNPDIPKMQTKRTQRLDFKVNLFSSLKRSIWTTFFLRGLRQGTKQSRYHSIFAFWYEGWRHKYMLGSVTILRTKFLGYYIWHWIKYLEMKVFSDPYFPVYGQNRIRIGYDSVHKRKNTDQRKSSFRDISCTVKAKNFVRSSTLIRRW